MLALIVPRYAQLGCRQITFILDNRRIHGGKMKAALTALLAEIALAQGVTVTFLHTPVYSPQFNPAEYLIHFIRRNALDQLPVSMSVNDSAERIRQPLAPSSSTNPSSANQEYAAPYLRLA